MMTATLVEACW